MNFKVLPPSYDSWYQTPLGFLAHTLEQEAVFALAGVKPGEWILDIGCGTGIYTLDLARRDAQVIGIDPSIEMIRIAREKLRRAGLKGHFVCGLAEALPLRSEAVDVALAVTSLCFVRRPDLAIEEMHRVIKSGGRLIIGELNRFSLWAILRRLKGLFSDTIYNQAHFWSRRELERLLGRNGFMPGDVRIVLYFPPINQKAFLKYYRFFEWILKRILPGTGAFIAMKGEKPLHSKGPNSMPGVFREG